MNANTDTNRSNNYCKLQCYPSTFLGINTYTNSGLLRNNNNTNTVSPSEVEITLTSQIIEYNKIIKKFNGTINGTVNLLITI